jgi:hypothetical protein
MHIDTRRLGLRPERGGHRGCPLPVDVGDEKRVDLGARR